MIEVQPKTIELPIGHKDKEGTLHNKVTFGKRITGRDLFLLESSPMASIPTQYQDLIMRVAITAFGTLRMPVVQTILLDLDTLDREDLAEAYQSFIVEGLGGREPVSLAVNKVKLALGFEHNEVVYDVVEFGTRLTGRDEVAADRLDLEGLKRACYMIGKQITKLSQSDGGLELSGPIDTEWFEKLDGVDILSLRVSAERWRQSFRLPRKAVQEEGDGESSLPAGQGTPLERGADSANAA
jgi:hypothetical protein